MGLSTAIDLTVDHQETVVALIQKHLPNTTAWAYGSRVKWTSHPNSDLDIVIFAPPERLRQVSELRDAFSESNLPFRVDLFVWDAVPDTFRKNIENNHMVLVESPNMTALKDIVDLRISSVDNKINDDEYSVAICNYIDVYKNSFIQPDIQFMGGTATEVEISKFTLKQEDVIITKDSEQYDDIGVPALMRHEIDNLVCGYRLAILRPDTSKVYGSYLYYALNTVEARDQFHSYANGVKKFGLRKADIGRLEIPLPDISRQRTVADMLVVLDDNIDLNRRMNHTLEEMAALLYREWFVYFRFPGHEDVGLVDSDLGPIPEGWEVAPLIEMCSFVMGQSPRSEHYNDIGEGLPFHQGVTGFGPRYPSHTKWTTVDKRVAEPGDILFSVRAPVGRINLAPDRLVVGRGLSAIRDSDGHQNFLLMQLKDRFAVEDSTGGGTVFKAVTKRDMESIMLLKPMTSLVKKFEAAVAPLEDLIANLSRQSVLLREARDLLLPRLISGELDVSELDLELEASVV
ncbi:restriction endonuclease subunit S [Candidatus Poriferisocius sp.]|uniref:restriction endonuclease subunit S n=1 Tax=Candidatus Poriferisocius sp. TaxID=3101276 RepID=UPI003B02AA22